MKILAISYLFPNSIYPNHGIFVLNRLKAIHKYCDVKVINPIPWFPFSSCFRRYKNYNKIPKKEFIEGIEVFHPRFFIIPRYLKFLDAITFCLAAIPVALKIKKHFLFDLIDLHWTYPDLLSGYLLSTILHKKQLLTIRGNEALNLFLHNKQLDKMEGEESVYVEERSIRSKIIKYLLPKSNYIITLSYELKKKCVSYGVLPKNTEVIRNGVDTSTFRFIGKDICRSKLGLSQDEYIILSIGSLSYGKGFDRIIRVFPEVIKKHPNSALYIIGSEGPAGYFRDNLYKLIKRYNLGDKVNFTGEIKNHDLVLWYNAADIYCLSSRGEGSPNVLSEALACGCPAIATDVGSVSEILNKDFMGFVVPNNDKKILLGLLSALSCEYDRVKISKYMQQYDWDWCAKKVIQVYKRLLEEKP